MFIQSGGLVTISKISAKIRVLKSMRWILFVAFMCMGIVPVIIVGAGVYKTSVNSYIEQRELEITTYASVLAKELSNSSYFDNLSSPTLNAEIKLASDMYNGRIIVVNKDYKIVKDTYYASENKYIVTDEVIKSLKGKRSSVYESTKNFFEIIEPIELNAKEKSKETQYNGAVLMSFKITDISDYEEEQLRKLQLLIVLESVILFPIALILSQKLVRPLRKVADSIEQISDGYTEETVEESGYAETMLIANAFNTMVSKTKQLDVSRQEFVSNVSHELKTPITSIKVLADSLLMQEDVPAELYREFLGDIAEEIDRENKIINDLLSLVKMDKTASVLNISQVNIDELLELILKRLRPIAAKRNIELVLESYRSVVAEIDEVKLTLAISNLVENAIKYNVESGWVRVSLNADHKFFYIKVSDSGIGIPEDAQEHVFERFYRVDKARSRETGGTGLGLSITKNAILMHKGVIKLYSNENEGTTFTVKIPLNYIS